MKNDWFEKELTIEIVVGAFMLMIFLGVGYFTIMLSRETWFGTKYEKTVSFRHVMGLKEGDDVMARGMPVGKVNHLEFGEDDEVLVVVTLDEQLNMRSRYKITIVPTSILGGRYLEINEGEGDPLPAGSILRGREPSDLMADATDLLSAIRKGVVEDKMIDNFVEASRQVKEISARLNEGKGLLGRFLSEDESIYEDLVSSVKSMNRIAARLEKGEGFIGKLLSSDEAMYDDLKAAVASLNRIAAKVESGEGFVGRIVQDDGLYDEMQGMIKEARATIDDYRETAPIVTFSSIFFGAF